MKILFGVLTVLFFFVYSFYSFSILKGNEVKFNSPYDTASYFFIQQFSKEKKIGYDEPLLALSGNLAHPRSMSEWQGRVVPTIFLGFIFIVGGSGNFLGDRAILFIIPFFAALTGVFFYRLFCRITDQRCALISTLLFLIHPAYWYYANRSMLPNILLVDLLIIGVFFLVKSYEQKKNMYCILGSLCVALAVTIRPPEFLWMLFLACLCVGWFRKKIPPWMIISFFSVSFFVLSVYLFENSVVFGNPLSFGYKPESFLASPDTFALHEKGIFASLSSFFFPFGFHPRAIVYLFRVYGLQLFWWFSIPAFFGYFLALTKIVQEVRQRIYSPLFLVTLFFTGTTLWIVSVYGSFMFSENVTGHITPGTSYIRYWLPFFILSTLYVGIFIQWIYNKISKKYSSLFIILCCTVLVFFSARIVLWQTNESLFALVQTIADYQKKSKIIQKLVPQHAIIFSPASDKIFFPQRKAAASFPRFAELPSLTPLLKNTPVYYYGLWSAKEIDEINTGYFNKIGYRLELMQFLDEKEKLFKVVSTVNSKQ